MGRLCGGRQVLPRSQGRISEKGIPGGRIRISGACR